MYRQRWVLGEDFFPASAPLNENGSQESRPYHLPAERGRAAFKSVHPFNLLHLPAGNSVADWIVWFYRSMGPRPVFTHIFGK
jgi:hypothetical protein